MQLINKNKQNDNFDDFCKLYKANELFLAYDRLVYDLLLQGDNEELKPVFDLMSQQLRKTFNKSMVYYSDNTNLSKIN